MNEKNNQNQIDQKSLESNSSQEEKKIREIGGLKLFQHLS